jgi:hypothetical protein
MQSSIFFLLLWLVDFLSIHLLGLVFPNMIVLGNWRFSGIEASIYAGFWLTFFVWMMGEYMTVREVEFKSSLPRFVFLFFINSLGVWIVSRYSQYAGLGITSFWWAFVLGGVTSTLQLVSWNVLEKKLKD